MDYTTGDGTATAGSDYTANSGTLTFADGETSKTFTVAITDDATYEGNETVNLTLNNASAGAALGAQNPAVLTITDNEAAQPGAPTNVAAVAGNGQVTVSWSEVPDSVSYNVYSSITSGTYTTPATTVAGAVYSCDVAN